MIRGIIYKYTSPSNKVYIGQTINEKERRKKFNNLSVPYAGDKIDNARKKYGPSNFNYEVLEVIESNTNNELSKLLNDKEIYYIGLYDSYKNGYNMSLGGEGSSGYKLTEKQKEKCKLRMLTDNPFKSKTHSKETKRIIGEKNSKAVLQIDINTNEVLAEFPSAKAAGEFLGKPRANSEIVKVCKGYVAPSGRHYITALGYKWKYKESSTTISKESTSQANGDGNGEVPEME